MDASRRVDVNDMDTLRLIGAHLRRLGSVSEACDILRRLGDHRGLIELLVESQAWNEALALAKEHPAYHKEVYLPYGRWLAQQEKFREAQQGAS